MRDSDYIFAVARIRVLERGLLTQEDYRQLVALPGVPEVLSYLRSRGWGAGEGEDADAMLASEAAKIEAEVQELGLDRALLDVIDTPQRYHNAKAAIKEVYFGSGVPGAYYQVEGYGRERLVHAVSARDFQGMPRDLATAAQHALDVVTTTSDPQWCDVIVDKACLKSMEAAAAESGSELLQRYVRAFVQNANIKIALRGARTGKSRRFLSEAMCHTHGLNKRRLMAHALGGKQELLGYLEEIGLGEASEAIRESTASFERWCETRLLDVLAGERSKIDSPGPILAYVLTRRNELRNVRILTVAKANGFGEDAILERMCVAHG